MIATAIGWFGAGVLRSPRCILLVANLHLLLVFLDDSPDGGLGNASRLLKRDTPQICTRGQLNVTQQLYPTLVTNPPQHRKCVSFNPNTDGDRVTPRSPFPIRVDVNRQRRTHATWTSDAIALGRGLVHPNFSVIVADVTRHGSPRVVSSSLKYSPQVVSSILLE